MSKPEVSRDGLKRHRRQLAVDGERSVARGPEVRRVAMWRSGAHGRKHVGRSSWGEVPRTGMCDRQETKAHAIDGQFDGPRWRQWRTVCICIRALEPQHRAGAPVRQSPETLLLHTCQLEQRCPVADDRGQSGRRKAAAMRCLGEGLDVGPGGGSGSCAWSGHKQCGSRTTCVCAYVGHGFNIVLVPGGIEERCGGLSRLVRSVRKMGPHCVRHAVIWANKLDVAIYIHRTKCKCDGRRSNEEDVVTRTSGVHQLLSESVRR